MLTDMGGSGDEDILQLHDCRGAGFDCGITGDHEEPDRLDHAIGALGDGGCFTCEDLSRGCLGVDCVVVADSRFGVRVRGIHLANLDPVVDEEASEAGRIGTGGLHTECHVWP